MSDKTGAALTADRPPQVTVAGWVSILGSVFLVAGMFEAVGRLRSIEQREAIEEALGTAPFDGLGLDVAGMQSLFHAVFVTAGGLATASAILGWFVLRRHKQARIVLSIIAVPIFVTGFFTSSFYPALIAVSAMLLWSGPARDWFAGRPVRRPALMMPPPRPQAPPGAPLPPVQPGVPSTTPPPYAGFGAPAASSRWAPAPVASRPPALIAATIITWVASALVAAVCAVGVLSLLVDPDGARRMMEEQGLLEELDLTFAEFRSGTIGVAVVFIGWALTASLLALLVMLRVAWARPMLIASAVASGLLSCFAFQMLAPVVTAVAGMVTAYLLLRPEVARWLDRR